MSESIPYTTIMERVKDDIDYIANEAYQKGYALGKYEASHWIPCSERLPENEGEVIVSIRDETGDTKYDYVSVGWIMTGCERWVVDNELNNYVIAWMPLPEPYKGV